MIMLMFKMETKLHVTELISQVYKSFENKNLEFKLKPSKKCFKCEILRFISAVPPYNELSSQHQ